MRNYPGKLLLAMSLLSFAPFSRGLELIATHEEIAERGRVPRYIARTEKGSFGFMAPPNWSVHADLAGEAIQLTREASGAALRISFSVPAAKEAVASKTMRAEVERRFAGAVIVDDYQCSSRDGEGRAVEARFTVGGGLEYRVRLAWVDCGGTIIAISLVGPEEGFGKLHSSWTYLLNSLAAGKQ